MTRPPLIVTPAALGVLLAEGDADADADADNESVSGRENELGAPVVMVVELPGGEVVIVVPGRATVVD